jgi:ATP-binding cassette, subfamily B, bacterial PglK
MHKEFSNFQIGSAYIYLFKSLWLHLTIKRQFQFKCLVILSILVSIFEIFSLGSLIPFLGVLVTPSNQNPIDAIRLVKNYFRFSSENEFLIFFTLTFCMFVVLATISRLILLRLSTKICYAVGSELSRDIYEKILYQKYSYHLALNSSEVIAATSSKVNTVISGEIIASTNLITSSIMLLMIFIALVIFNPKITLFTIISFAIIYMVVMRFTKNQLTISSNNIAIESNRVVRFLQEGLGGIRDVIIGGFQASYVAIFSRADHSLRESQGTVAFLSQYPRYLIEGLGMLVVATLALFLALNSDPNESLTAIPILGVYALASQRLLPILQTSYASWAQIIGNKDTFIDVIELLNQPTHNVSKILTPICFSREIEFCNMGFSYSPKLPEILKGVNLKIPMGSCVGIVGRTGSGKSTFVDLLMGLLSPTSGHILIDGLIITESNVGAWQNLLAHVPQSIYLADASIQENIAFGIPKSAIDHSHLKHVASIAQIAGDIESWPKQYETIVGERGVRLSGGQRQRIGLARALYSKSKVLILDEATSALDSDTEGLIIGAIEERGKFSELGTTIFMVAHRLSTLKNCTHIIEIDNSKVTLKSNT